MDKETKVLIQYLTQAMFFMPRDHAKTKEMENFIKSIEKKYKQYDFLSILKEAKEGDVIKRYGLEDDTALRIVDLEGTSAVCGLYDMTETSFFLANDWVFVTGY